MSPVDLDRQEGPLDARQCLFHSIPGVNNIYKACEALCPLIGKQSTQFIHYYKGQHTMSSYNA